MFHAWIGELGLLAPSTESNILGRFPLSVRKSFIADVTAVLLAPGAQDDRALLSSPAHVRWCMEVIGHGFALPIDDHRLISCVTAARARDAYAHPADHRRRAHAHAPRANAACVGTIGPVSSQHTARPSLCTASGCSSPTRGRCRSRLTGRRSGRCAHPPRRQMQ